jgi:ankyrin repeat protein
MRAAADHGSLALVTCLVLLLQEAGVKVGQEVGVGFSPLAAAAYHCYSYMVRCLVDSNANSNQKDADGYTALNAAIQAEELDMVRCLVGLGADVDLEYENGNTVLHCEAQNGQVGIVRCLVRVGADVDKSNDIGITPFIFAAANGNLDMVKCLVELGADVDKHGGDLGWTALIIAANMGMLDMVRCLVELSASIELVDNAGQTALNSSAFQGSTMQFLLEHAGASIKSVDYTGQTAWELLNYHLLRAEEDLRIFLEDGEEIDQNRDDPAAPTALLRVMVLRGAPPFDDPQRPFCHSISAALLSPENARVVQEGARLRVRLPAYLSRRRALLDAHCPVLLPPLRDLVYEYMELTTTQEFWSTGLGEAP